MTLNEAIEHAMEVAEEKDTQAGFDTDYLCYQMSNTERNQCKKCADEHRQLANWLKELKQLREQTRWIPVKEKLPEEHICDDGYVEPSDLVWITTADKRVLTSRYWGNRISKITEESECRPPEYYDWVEAELWEDDVIAWMPFSAPKPYEGVI